MNASLAFMPHVGSDVQKALLAERVKQPIEQAGTTRESHPTHRKEDKTYRCFSFKEVEFERNAGLQFLPRDLQMHHAERIPVADEQSFTDTQAGVHGISRNAR